MEWYVGGFTQQSDLKLWTTTLMSNENNVSETEDKKTTFKKKNWRICLLGTQVSVSLCFRMVWSHRSRTFSNTFHTGLCLISRIRYGSQGGKMASPKGVKDISQQNQVPMLWATTFLASKLMPDVCMKNVWSTPNMFWWWTADPCENHQQGLRNEKLLPIPACDTIADQWSGNTCSWPSGFGQLQGDGKLKPLAMGTNSWLCPPKTD